MPTNACSIQYDLPLPEAPDTGAVLDAIDARLAVVECLALPSTETTLAFLRSVWECDSPDAIPVFDDPDHPIQCRPEGADRVSSAAAAHWTVICERIALGELKSAVELYDAGGSRIAFEIGDLGIAPDGAADFSLPSSPADGREATPRIPPVSWLKAYLAQIRRECEEARVIRDPTRSRRLNAERDGVVAYLRRRFAAQRAITQGSAPTARGTGRARRVA